MKSEEPKELPHGGELMRREEPPLQPARYYPQPDPIYIEDQDEDQVHLLDYWRVLVKRRWTILAFTAVVLLITGIVTWRATPVYRATIKVQIDPEQANVLPFKEALDPGGNYAQSQEYLQTHFKVLASRTLADRVIRALDLEKHPEFLRQAAPSRSMILGWVRSLFTGESEDTAEISFDRHYSRYTKAFTDNLTVTPIRNSRLVDVHFDSIDPELAARVVNTLADQYINLNFETKYDATTKATDFLAGQLVELKAKVERSEEELVRFSRQHDIYTIGEKENVILQKLSDLNIELTSAQADRILKESAWRIVQATPLGNFPDILRSELIRELETNVAALKVNHARLAASFKPGWPELDQVAGQLAEAERQLATARMRAIRNVETEYKTAVQREQLLTKALEDQKGEASALNQNSIQYNILKREVESSKQLYDGLLQRLKEAGVSAGLKSNNIHVVDAAERPRRPHRPNKTLNLSLALAIGLMLGVGLAFFLEYLDSSVKTPDDVDRYIKLPSLGVIPAVSSFLPASERRLLTSGNGKGGAAAASPDMISHLDGKSVISEAYRNLRTSVLLSSGEGGPPKTLVITSSQKGEGKTTTATNLAITLAQGGQKVAVMDCDMRNPRIHRVMKVENGKGMSSYLSGNSDLMPLVRQTEVPSLFVVTAGRVPPNPAELVGSRRMAQALEELSRHFDHVVIDSPPVLLVTDARILAAMVDGVVLVIKGGETPKEAVIRTKRLLQDVHARIVGTLLNNVDVHSADYYYYSKYYYYGYGKGKYGYGYGNVQPADSSAEDAESA